MGRGAFAVGVVAVVGLSVVPAPTLTQVPAWMIFWDKLQHGIAYASVAGVGTLGFGATGRGRRNVALGLIALGAGLEVVQYFLPTRSFDLADLLANTTGIAIGLGGAVGLLRLATGRPRCDDASPAS